eukprot:7610892-Lingulodinium_polyedra.AAC.1
MFSLRVILRAVAAASTQWHARDARMCSRHTGRPPPPLRAARRMGSWGAVASTFTQECGQAVGSCLLGTPAAGEQHRNW